MYSTRQTNTALVNSPLQIQCRDGVTVQNVFYVQHAVPTSASKLTLQIKSIDINAIFGVSNF